MRIWGLPPGSIGFEWSEVGSQAGARFLGNSSFKSRAGTIWVAVRRDLFSDLRDVGYFLVMIRVLL